MGMWQLFAAANVLAHPIRGIFPLRGSAYVYAYRWEAQEKKAINNYVDTLCSK